MFLHEQTHAEIFRQANCSEIRMGLGPGYAYTEADCSNLEAAEKATLRITNGINEIIGYNIIPLLLIILAVMLMQKEA